MTEGCLGIEKIEHGQVTPSVDKYLVGSSVTVTCDDGYEASTSKRTIYCLSGGVWSKPIPKCNQVKCQKPVNPINGYYVVSNSETNAKSLSELPLGTVITGLCSTGYESNSNHSMTCQGNKKWSGTETVCTPVVCSYPANIANGYYSFRNSTEINKYDINVFDTFQYQTVIYANCIKGYNLTNSEERTCGSSKIWSGEEPACNIVTCDFPGWIQNGNYAKQNTFSDEKKNPAPYLNGKSNYSEEITVLCVRGYNLTSANKIRECNSEGFWTGENPVCSLVTCKWPLNVSNGRYIISTNLTADIMPYNTTTTAIVCDDSFELVGNYRTRRCNEEGSWDGASAVCCKDFIIIL